MVVPNISKEIIKLFTGVCTIYNTVSDEDEKGITRQEFKAIHEDIPCRLSSNKYSQRYGNLTKGDNVSMTAQNVTLFLANDVEIKAGSRISVTQNGVTRNYKYSGTSSVYTYHQEVELELEEYA